MKNWKQYKIESEVQVTFSLIWSLIKKRFRKEPYKLSISFLASHGSEVMITGAQIEYKE